jgi:hypothetical protein
MIRLRRHGIVELNGGDIMEKVDKEFINQLKYVIDNFSCQDKRFEDGFVGGLFYVLTWIQYGKSYADHKIDMLIIKSIGIR